MEAGRVLCGISDAVMGYRMVRFFADSDELIAEGGRVMVPCLRIEEGVEAKWLYDSNDIIRFLNTRFG